MDDIMDAQINNNLQARQQISAIEFASKYKSKREVYNFLTLEVQAYLPNYDTITIYFLKDLIYGKKKGKPSTLFWFIINITLVVKAGKIS